MTDVAFTLVSLVPKSGSENKVQLFVVLIGFQSLQESIDTSTSV